MIRSRFTAVRIALALVLIAGFLAIDPLVRSGGGAPPDHTARLVPADVLLYLHVQTDRGSDQWKRGVELAGRFPSFARLRDRVVRGLTRSGAALDLDRDVGPWLGDEASLALLDTGGGIARSLILLGVSDRDRAAAFLSRVAGRSAVSRHRGTRIRTFGAVASAFVGGFLAIGQPESVRAAIDLQAGTGKSLDRNATFRRARGGLPDEDRLLYVYASQDGVRRLVRAQSGLIGQLGVLIDDPTLQGAAAALRAERDGVRLNFASALNAALNRRRAGEGAFRHFTPSLADVVPRNAIAYLDLQALDRILRGTVALAGDTPPSLGRSIQRFKANLRRRAGLDFERDVARLLRGETALFVTPSRPAPILTLVVGDVNEQAAGDVLSRLQIAVAELLAPSPATGQVPTFEPREIDGVTAATLRISPTVALTYAVFDGRAVVSTSPQGIGLVKSAKSSILDNPLFKTAFGNRPENVSSVVFLNLRELLALGERAGLSETLGYRALRADLSKIRAAGAATSSDAGSQKAEIFFEVP